MIARLAERGHGVVARRELLDAGLNRDAIDRRVNLGRLHVVHHGVYAVGHRVLGSDGRWKAATLAAGPGAVLSHRSAAALWLLRQSDLLEVTAVNIRRRPGIHIHKSCLPPDEVTSVRGIPVTTVPRTLLDLAAVLRPNQVERATRAASPPTFGGC